MPDTPRRCRDFVRPTELLTNTPTSITALFPPSFSTYDPAPVYAGAALEISGYGPGSNVFRIKSPLNAVVHGKAPEVSGKYQNTIRAKPACCEPDQLWMMPLNIKHPVF